MKYQRTLAFALALLLAAPVSPFVTAADDEQVRFAFDLDRASASGSVAAAKSLYAQALSALLVREFPGSDISYVVLDAHTGAVLASRWNDLHRPVSVGSLVKPFTAVAYADAHGRKFPEHICRGTASGCWLARGHGRVDIISAIAFSCNSYFRFLASRIPAAQAALTVRQFGLPEPQTVFSVSTLVGLNDGWRVPPLRLARAYLEMVHRGAQAGVEEVLAGMAASARMGTGQAVGRALQRSSALVKTGTAPCTHARRAPGDGFVVALLPADSPSLLLLVRGHSVPGAQAAITAGQILHTLEEQTTVAD